MIKIQLDYKTVEHILANDPDFVIEIRKAILHQAVKKSTTAVTNQKMSAVWRQIIEEEIEKRIGTVEMGWGGKVNTLAVNVDFRSKLETAAKEIVSKIVDEATETSKIRDQIEKEIEEYKTAFNRLADAMIAKHLYKAVDGHINTEVDRRVEERLQQILGGKSDV